MKIIVRTVTAITIKNNKDEEDITKVLNETFENKTLEEIENVYCERFLCDKVLLKVEIYKLKK